MDIITDRIKLGTAAYIIIFFLIQASLSSCSAGPGYNHPRVKGGKILIDVESLRDGRPEFFSVDVKSSRVDFFVIRLNGSVESYLDACKNCYRFKKGYKVESSLLVCKYCGNSYSLDSLKKAFTGCHPMPLRGEIEGSSYVITLTEMKKAARYF